MTMRIITTNRNSSVGHGGWRHYAEVVVETEGGERQYVFGACGSMELYSVFRTSGVAWYMEGDSWCDEDPYLTSICDFASLEQAKADAVYGSFFQAVAEMLEKEKATL